MATIIGTSVADTFVGGVEDNLYSVDNSKDVVIETSALGIDTVKSSVSYTLGANVENLTLTGGGSSKVKVGGTLATVYGNPTAWASYLDYYQGDNDLGYANDCGVVSCENILIQMGLLDFKTGYVASSYKIDSLETSMVRLGVLEHLVDTSNSYVYYNGGMDSMEDFTLLLSNYELDSTVKSGGLGVVGECLKGNKAVGIAVDALVLWGLTKTYSSVNHAIVVTGVAYDSNDNIVGFYVCDSGRQRKSDSSRYVSYNLLSEAYGGSYLVTTDADYTKLYLDNINGTGNELNNTITGNYGNNILSGLAGNDVIDGGYGKDTLLGGVGDDTYLVDSAKDIVTERANYKLRNGTLVDFGTDTIILDSTYNTNKYNMAKNVENLDLSTLNASMLVAYGNSSANIITGGSSTDTIYGLAGADSIVGNAGDDYIDGGAGIDTLVGGDGNDTYVIDSINDVITESGSDIADVIKLSNTFLGNIVDLISVFTSSLEIIDASSVSKSLMITGNTITTMITGGKGSDYITGNISADIINGGNGKDTIIGGKGNDSLYGGLGNDTYLIGSGDGNDIINDVGGANVIRLGTDINFSDVVFSTDSSKTDIILTMGTQKLDIEDFFYGKQYSGTGLVFADGTKINRNNYTGLYFDSSGNNSDISNSIAFKSSEFIIASTGNDTINGWAGNDIIIGGAGNDYLVGYTGNDILVGGDGDDILEGGVGNDTLYGCAGTNNLDGGAGNDSYIIDGSEAGSVITDSAGVDTVKLTENYTTNYYTLNDNIEKLDASLATSTLTLTGNGLSNIVTGNSSNNTLSGGVDKLADTLIGGVGDDIYTLYGTNDRVKELVNGGLDTIILDSSYLWKKYSLSGTNVEELNASALSSNLTLVGSTYSDTIIGGSGKDIINSGKGNDYLTGGAGNDTLIGGVGSDTYIFSAEVNDADTIRESASKTDIDIVSISGTTTDDILVYKNYGNHYIIDYGTNAGMSTIDLGTALNIEKIQLADSTGIVTNYITTEQINSIIMQISALNTADSVATYATVSDIAAQKALDTTLVTWES